VTVATALEDIRAHLCLFIIENFLYGAADELPPDGQSLITSEIIDSTGVVELVVYLEESHGIRVDDDDITPENFDSIAGLVNFVSTKQTTIRT